MNSISGRIGLFLLLPFMALALMECDNLSSNQPEFSPTQVYLTPAPGIAASQNRADAAAQATIEFGRNQLVDLSRKGTEVSLNMSQAANVEARSTQEEYQRQKLEMDYQATIVSMNMAQAAATQKIITQQTQIARDGTAFAQSSAATATYSAYLLNVSQTAQAQAILEARGTQTAQAVAAIAEYPLTATPFAVTQAVLLMQEYDREQQNFMDQVVAPLIPFLAILVLLLFILTLVLAYRRFMPTPWPRPLLNPRINFNSGPVITIDGVSSDHNPRLHRIIPAELAPTYVPGLPGENLLPVEIVNANELPVSRWIAEVEDQLSAEGGLSL